MIEFLQWTLGSFPRFVGVIILFVVFVNGLECVIKALWGRFDSPEREE